MLQLQHIAKDCRKPKKEKETKKYDKYDKVEHLVKNCRLGHKIKKRSIQNNSDDENKEDNDKKESFLRGSE